MVMKFKIHTFANFSPDGGKCSAASSKDTAHNSKVGRRASNNMLMTDWKSLHSAITPTYRHYKHTPFHLIQDNIKY